MLTVIIMINNLTLPDFTRISYSSQNARLWWEPRIRRFSKAFCEIERYTVVEGYRRAAWEFINASELPSITEWGQQHDIAVIPTSAVSSNPNQPYTNIESNIHSEHSQKMFRCLFIKSCDFKSITRSSYNEHVIGELLGYPTCCQEAFTRLWNHDSCDYTHHQLSLTRNFAHTLWRHLGVRLVPHLPCKFDCKESQRIADYFIATGRKYGYQEEIDDALEILSWPIEWSRKFGIAELTSPVVKIASKTEWSSHREAHTYTGEYEKVQANWWKNNGFSSAAAMNDAHSIMATTISSQIASDEYTRITDLGCGNGRLLQRIQKIHPAIGINGVDCSASAIAEATKNVSGLWTLDRIQDVRWSSWKSDMVIINPIRLQEMNETERNITLTELLKISKIIVYNYDRRDITELCIVNGLPAPTLLAKTPAVSIGIISTK